MGNTIVLTLCLVLWQLMHAPFSRVLAVSCCFSTVSNLLRFTSRSSGPSEHRRVPLEPELSSVVPVPLDAGAVVVSGCEVGTAGTGFHGKLFMSNGSS